MMLRRMSLRLFTFAMSAFSMGANAGQAAGTVNHVIVGNDSNVVIFSVNGGHSGKPSCSVNGDDFAVSVNAAAAKLILATILHAQAIGKPVQVYGSNTCNAIYDREGVNYVNIQY